jgi:nucleotide-binding universal stress UspA family protein
MGDDIIVGYDASECAQAALALALDASRALGGKLVVVFGFDNPLIEGGDLRRSLEELGQSRVADAAQRAHDAGIEVETLVSPKSPAHALAALAAERQARMIVVGTHGESPLRAAILGSVPHKLLQLSESPVLVVPAPS